jgi:hypothetical protein
MEVEILAFDGVEDLDVCGPLSVLAPAGFEVTLVAEDGPRQVRAAHGTGLAAREPGAAPGVLLVPGGGWISRSERGAWAEAGRGVLPVLIAELSAVGARVIGDARVVDDGQIVTAGGITAGLDLGLWLVQRYRGPAAAAAAAAAAGLEYTRTGYVWRRPATVQTDLEFPQTQLAKVADELARAAEPDFMYNHSARSYLFARVAAAARGLTAGEGYDDELLFLSCILHDIGLTTQADRGRRFEVDGAEAAVDLLRANGLEAARAQIVWDAIASLHYGRAGCSYGRPVGAAGDRCRVDLWYHGAGVGDGSQYAIAAMDKRGRVMWYSEHGHEAVGHGLGDSPDALVGADICPGDPHLGGGTANTVTSPVRERRDPEGHNAALDLRLPFGAVVHAPGSGRSAHHPPGQRARRLGADLDYFLKRKPRYIDMGKC